MAGKDEKSVKASAAGAGSASDAPSSSSPPSKEARREAEREERDAIRRKKREISAQKAVGAVARFVRGNVVTVVIALFLPTILGILFFMVGATVLDKSSTSLKWGWGMAAIYGGLLANIAWARYVAPRLDRKVGKAALPEENST